MLTKNCPHCKDHPLEATNYQGEEIDICRECGGLWFEKNEVNRMISEINDGPEGDKFETHFGEPLGISELDCPDCKKSLERFHLLEAFHTEIDVCRHCDGTWIDKDELESVEKSPEIKASLGELNQKVSWKTYLFQFLTQMPVEYNIKPQKTPWVTRGLIVLNTLIFALYFLNPSSFSYVIDNFAMTPADLSKGNELWTVLTCVFLHGSIMHLFGNMYFLYIVGDNLEDVLGHKRFLLWYLACGLLASFASYIVSPMSNIPGVGASGAIAGLFGMYLIWFRHASLTFMFVIYQKKLSAVWFFAIWLGFNIFGAVTGPDGIDYGAHIGGFIAGLIIGYILKSKILEQNPIIRLLNQKEAQLKR
ncbi:rhomboid family intramembrane serine protease [Pseudoalteromonas sp. SWYJZ12]|uniref:rhomboid family intramembrane serine protease n=1 Tax=Pseudoalteromonas sp. SWYJZ12 TaxID=2792067 RepID=UPI0018CD6807|nr:rhomboid family intramembrane serine protease [Pseudoalteromonas sp. SWYJZ12]MBH0003414.1 rhomboid family intramembrane serine protease [Pseudoalteromonas sp. SWYJZ12]